MRAAFVVGILVATIAVAADNEKEIVRLQTLANEVKDALTKGNLVAGSQLAQELSVRIARHDLALKLEELENQLPAGGAARIYPLGKAAQAAFATGDYAKAEAFAKELLVLAQQHPQDPYQGSAVFYGHMVLGRVALARDRSVEAAKYELLESGKTAGSPVLKSFGPNMSLAQDLLAVGERAVVLQFFEQCKVFWKGTASRQDLRNWTEALQSCCRMPNFGANLVY